MRLTRRVWLVVAAVGVAGAVGSGFIARRNAQNKPEGPQCGHWVIERSCELLGVAVDMEMIVKFLPPAKRGHSMLEISKVLQGIGLDAEGRELTYEQLIDESGPYIAHMTHPDHFVVVVGGNSDYVHIFDGDGRKLSRPTSHFRQHWDGKALHVSRPAGDERPLPKYLAGLAADAPRIQFDTLYIDRGEIPYTGQKVPYRFRFVNLGNSALRITGIKTTCTCTDSHKPDDPIPPGGEGWIELNYMFDPTKEASPMDERTRDGSGAAGAFAHNAYVKTNDPYQRAIRLTVAGNLDSSVQVIPAKVSKVTPQGTGLSINAFVVYSGDHEEFSVNDCVTANNRIRVECKPFDMLMARDLYPDGSHATLSPRRRYLLQISAEQVNEIGRIEDEIHLATNIAGFERISLPVSIDVVNPVGLRPSLLFFGEIDPSEQVEQTVTLRGIDTRRFRILDVATNIDDLSCDYDKDLSCDAKQLRFSTRGAVAIKETGQSVEIRVELPDSDQEVALKLPVYATVKPNTEASF